MRPDASRRLKWVMEGWKPGPTRQSAKVGALGALGLDSLAVVLIDESQHWPRPGGCSRTPEKSGQENIGGWMASSVLPANSRRSASRMAPSEEAIDRLSDIAASVDKISRSGVVLLPGEETPDARQRRAPCSCVVKPTAPKNPLTTATPAVVAARRRGWRWRWRAWPVGQENGFPEPATGAKTERDGWSEECLGSSQR